MGITKIVKYVNASKNGFVDKSR